MVPFRPSLRLGSMLLGGGVVWSCLISPNDYPLDGSGSGGHDAAPDGGAAGAVEGGSDEPGSGGTDEGSGGTDEGGGGTVVGPDTVTWTLGERSAAMIKSVTADTELHAFAPEETYNYGASPNIGPGGDPLRVALLRFDLRSVPQTASVSEARVSLWTQACEFCEGDPGVGIAFYELLEAWAEGTWSGTTGAANWSDRQMAIGWSGPGASPPSSGTAKLARFEPASVDTEYHALLPVTLVQRWISEPATNHGVLMSIDPHDPDGVVLFSSENAADAKRPLLTLELEL